MDTQKTTHFGFRDVPVADKQKLNNPALAAVVQNGDKILIYGQAKRLIVYRPSVHKIVTMLTIQDAPAGAS